MINNIFDNPQFYREKIIEQSGLIKNNKRGYDGKSLICVFFTSYCGVGCPFCFFHSPNAQAKINDRIEIENRFNEEAVDKFIEFANSANVGYLQISGGGEPFLEKEAILKSIKNINAERIILVTSGMWAKNRENAERYLYELYNALKERKTKTRLTIRVSISEHHSIKLEEKPLVNLLNIFEEKYSNESDFTLQLKTFENDNAMKKYLDRYFDGYKLTLKQENGTDDNKYIKVMPWKYLLTLKSGYQVVVGKSRIFNSNLRPNLYDKESIIKSEEIYDKDLQLSQNNNPSIMYNSDGSKGLDWIVEYNGNVCTWQNRVQDNLLNIYEDDYKTVFDKTMDDVLTYSLIDKGSKYRDKIISEISPKTVSLMKSVNIRDYAGTLLFEDEKIRLYYCIRVLQDYIAERRVNIQQIKEFPLELKNAIFMDKDSLIKLYKISNYSVLTQEKNRIISAVELRDFLELVKLGHYELNDSQINEAIKFYNSINLGKKINSTDEIVSLKGMETERRLTRRVMKIKNLTRFKYPNDKTMFYLCRHGETNWNVEKKIKGQLENANTFFTDNGFEQINDLISFLQENEIEAIFTSDLLRTKDTTRIINEELNLPVYYCRDFRGLNMGNFQGGSMSDFLKDENVKKAFIDYNVRIPGGESINELNTRFLSSLYKIVTDYPFKRVAVISHGAAISNVKSFISGEPYEDVDSCVLEYSDEKFKVMKSKQYKKYKF